MRFERHAMKIFFLSVTASLHFLAVLPSSAARAQIEADFSAGGGIRIGTSTSTCNAAAEGALRYNSAEICIELCDGDSWDCMLDSACDGAPSFFAFAEQDNLAPSSLYTSNIAAITGMDVACAAKVSVEGEGSPQYRICTNADCSSVDVTWTSANNTTAMQGKYLQLRATTSASEGTPYTITANIGPVSSTWTITTAGTPCSGESIGTVCPDGSVYAGTTPDGDVPFYVTRCDYNMTWDGSACTGSRQGITWNNGLGNWVNTTLSNCTHSFACPETGEANTTTLAAADSDSVNGGTQPHAAAKYCDDLIMRTARTTGTCRLRRNCSSFTTAKRPSAISGRRRTLFTGRPRNSAAPAR